MARPDSSSTRRRQPGPDPSAYPPTAELTIARIPLRAWALLAALAMVASLLPAGIASPIAAYAENDNGTPNFDHCPKGGDPDGSTDLFISADAGNGENKGTEDEPFATIGDAVNDAAANDGDTICVAAGTYVEQVTIDVAGLTLRGPNAETPGNAARGDEAVIVGTTSFGADNIKLVGLRLVSP